MLEYEGKGPKPYLDSFVLMSRYKDAFDYGFSTTVRHFNIPIGGDVGSMPHEWGDERYKFFQTRCRAWENYRYTSFF
jgi:hypothetical protein